MPHRRNVEDVDIPADPDDVFDELIESNDRVCKRCYRRHTRREDLSDAELTAPNRKHKGDRLAGVSAYVDYDVPVDGDPDRDRQYFEDVSLWRAREQAAHPDDPPSKTSTACRYCGTIDWHRTPPTRSRDEAIDAGAGISVTLEEFGVVHDWFRLLAAIGRLKRLPSTAGDDHETFATAVGFAIRNA